MHRWCVAGPCKSVTAVSSNTTIPIFKRQAAGSGGGGVPGDHTFPDVPPEGFPTSTSFTSRMQAPQMCINHSMVKMMKVNERRPKNVTARKEKKRIEEQKREIEGKSENSNNS